MNRRSSIFAWIAAAGVFLHVGTAAASTWCKVMGLVSSCCCPAAQEEESEWKAPSDCCRPAVAGPKMGLGEAPFSVSVDPAALPWDSFLLPVDLPIGWLSHPEPAAASPPLEALATIVIRC